MSKNVHLDNVTLGSPTGPNSFAEKLIKYASKVGWSFEDSEPPDAHLCFIEAQKRNFDAPMFQRLDGIYFNTKANYNLQNENIRRTYEMADGVIFQSEFNKRLTIEYFGEHHNSIIIHNGADLESIESVKPLENLVIDGYENVWACASHWRPHKRLKENIMYFLENSGENDCLVVAGNTDYKNTHKRVFFVGNIPNEALIALYKRSKYFIHLAWLDHCPNVVVDARASGCRIICSSAGGTREIAGPDAIVIQEGEWDFKPVDLYSPPKMNFNKVVDNDYNSCYNMELVVDKYESFCISAK